MTAPLDDDLAKLLAILPPMNLAETTPKSFRDTMLAMAAARAAVPPPPVAEIKDITVKGAAGPLAARVYRPATGGAPTVVFFHGGGWVGGDFVTHDRTARLLAIETGAVVISIDYRRPPEAPFPAAYEDAVAATLDVAARIGEFGGDVERMGIAGDSAGGNLAAAAAIGCRDAGLKLAAQLLIYPVADVTGRYRDTRENAKYPSRGENAEGYFLTLDGMGWFAEHYVSAAESSDWRVSPARCATLRGVAPGVVCVAQFDPLRDEGEAMARALIAAGVETKRHPGAGMIHGYFGMVDGSMAARLEAERVRADFKALLTR